MKNMFEEPKVTVCTFAVEDVITTSDNMDLEPTGEGGSSDY